MPAARAPGSSGVTNKAVSPSVPTTSGSAPPVVATSGTPHAMASMAGSENPSYSDGTTATCASAYMPANSSSEIPVTQRTARDSPSLSMVRATRPPSWGRPITTSSTSRSVRSLATASSRGTRPFMGTSLEEVTMMRPGIARSVRTGPEHGVVHPDRYHGHAGEFHAHLRRDVGLGGLRHRHHARELPGHPHLHPQEPEPPPLGQAAIGVLGMGQRQHAVDGDRVVERGEQRPPVGHHPHKTRSQALVVVDHVEFAAPGSQEPSHPEGERPGLGKARRAHDAELEQVDRRAELAAGAGRGRGRGPGRGRARGQG